MYRHRWKLASWLLLGTLLLQTAWVLAVPPFRAIDEFDHAYRAASVAQGEWLPSGELARRGRGELVTVPRTLVIAASPECETYKYTQHDNCHPAERLGNGQVKVASAASRYNPLFYWVIGEPASLLNGSLSLYAMRITGALLCALVIAAGGWAIALWAETPWPLLAFLVSMTPVMIYSTVVAAPNGLELSAALALWASMLGLTKARLAPQRQRLLLIASIPSAMTLAVLRSIGPLWLALIILTLGGLLGGSLPRLVQRHRLTSAIATATVGGATALGIWWTRFASTNSLANAPITVNDAFSPSDGARLVSLWFFQAIAAFPTRNEPAPTIVYATGAILVLTALGAGLWAAELKIKAVLTAAIVISVLTPLLLTIATYSKLGAAWQGRYGLPFCFGALIISGAALDRRRYDPRFLKPIIASCCGLMLIAHTASVTNVLLAERGGSPLAGDPSWLMPEPWTIVVIVLIGFLSWGVVLALSVMHRSPIGTAPQRPLRDGLDIPDRLA